VEIRYFGGKLYSQKKEEILSNIISIANCVNISMNNSNNDTYLMLFKNWDVDKEFDSLKREEKDYLKILFKTTNPIIIEKKFNKIKQEIEELRNKYNIGER